MNEPASSTRIRFRRPAARRGRRRARRRRSRADDDDVEVVSRADVLQEQPLLGPGCRDEVHVRGGRRSWSPPSRCPRDVRQARCPLRPPLSGVWCRGAPKATFRCITTKASSESPRLLQTSGRGFPPRPVESEGLVHDYSPHLQVRGCLDGLPQACPSDLADRRRADRTPAAAQACVGTVDAAGRQRMRAGAAGAAEHLPGPLQLSRHPLRPPAGG